MCSGQRPLNGADSAPMTHGTYDPDDDSTKTPERGYGEIEEGGPYLVKIEILTGPEENWQTRADYAKWLQRVYDDFMDSPTGNFQIVSVEEPDEAAQEKWWKEVWNK